VQLRNDIEELARIMNQRFDRIEQRLDGMKERLGSMDQRLEKMSDTLDGGPTSGAFHLLEERSADSFKPQERK
jgi:hypothetical protein